MARLLYPIALLGALSGILLLASQGPGQAKIEPKADTPLQLELQPTEIVEGLPSRFRFHLVNRTDHDVQLPTPTIKCTGGINGRIDLQLEFHPLHPRNSLGSGSFCDGGVLKPPSILIQLQSWKIVKPGKAMILEAPRGYFFYSDGEPGKYDFWATYTPPFINQVDQQFLQNAGIDFPRKELVSARLTFEKKP